MDEPNMKQMIFIKEYVKTGNGQEAYKKAYGEMEDDVARACASRLLTNANVKSYIDRQMMTFEEEVRKQGLDLAEIFSNAIAEIKSKQGKMPVKELIALLEKAVKMGRHLAERTGELSSGHSINIALLQADIDSGKPCPVCGGAVATDETIKRLAGRCGVITDTTALPESAPSL